MLKRVLLGVGVSLLLLGVSFATVMATTFAGLKELVDGTELPGGARTVKDGYVAIFVLPAGGSDVVLIDAGDDEKGAPLLAELTRRGATPDSVKAIFITHGHPDHVAAVHLFPKADVYGFAGDVKLAAGDERPKGPLPKMVSMPAGKPAKITKMLQDGVPVQVGALAVTPYLVPGHTAGSGVFLANGVLYMGDSATGAADGTVRSAPWVFSDDQAENRASLVRVHERLKAAGQENVTLAFAHSGPLKGTQLLAAAGAKP